MSKFSWEKKNKKQSNKFIIYPSAVAKDNILIRLNAKRVLKLGILVAHISPT